MTATEILGRMLVRLDGGRGWTKGTMARAKGRGGREVSADHPEAARWCLLGALYAEAGSFPSSPPFREVCRRLNRGIESMGFVVLNDRAKNFGEIKALIEAAIQDGK